ncbi:MAG: DUF4105 domain-containing protein [Candidatus Paceibacterota bacterium]
MKITSKKLVATFLCLVIAIALICYFGQTPPTNSDWPLGYSVTASSQINKNQLTVKNIRNFRYDQEGNVIKAEYYDQVYNLDELTKVWYIYEPFGNNAAHNLLSFEFRNNIFLTVSIEARTSKSQEYDGYVGLLRSYPLIYVVADERDTLFLRTNVRKNQVVLFPTKASPEAGRKLLIELFNEVNRLNQNPKWYNSLTDNCTTLIARHINSIYMGAVPSFSWKMYNTHSDEIPYDKGWIDTNLSLKEAEQYFNISQKGQSITDIENYSKIVRENLTN